MSALPLAAHCQQMCMCFDFTMSVPLLFYCIRYNANRLWWKSFAVALSFCYSQENFRDCIDIRKKFGI